MTASLGVVIARAANNTQALVYEAVLACTRVHFKNSVTREILYYRPRNQTLV